MRDKVDKWHVVAVVMGESMDGSSVDIYDLYEERDEGCATKVSLDACQLGSVAEVECSMQNLNTIRTAMHSWVKMGQALSPSKPGCVLDDEEVAGWWILL